MNTLEIPDKDLYIEVPSHWNEMTPKQVKYCLMQALKALQGDIPVERAKLYMFYHLAQIKRDWLSIFWERMWPMDKVIAKNANAWHLSQELITFPFRQIDKRSRKLELNFDTPLNFFAVVHVWKRFRRHKFIGPADLLTDLTFGEFRAAIEEMNEYFDSNDEHMLSRMIACLYRPERRNLRKAIIADDFDGKIKEPFNRNKIEIHAKVIDKMSGFHRLMILMWFTYCVKYIQTEDMIIEGRTINLKALFPRAVTDDQGKTKEKQKRTGSNWSSVLYQIAEKGVFGNIEKADATGIFDILLYMHDQHEKAKAQEREINRQKAANKLKK